MNSQEIENTNNHRPNDNKSQKQKAYNHQKLAIKRNKETQTTGNRDYEIRENGKHTSTTNREKPNHRKQRIQKQQKQRKKKS